MKKLWQWYLSLFEPKAKECEHRFNQNDVADLNMDPKCTRCGLYFEKIIQQAGNGWTVTFTVLNETEYGLKKVKLKKF
jgi:hypothetical protein